MFSKFNRIRVLVVEDHHGTARTMQALLNSLGFKNVQHAEDVPSAGDILQSGGVDLLLCDQNLGGLSGLSLIKSIRRLDGIGNPNLPIIMVTAHADAETVSNALGQGVDAVLAKPVQPDRLLLCLEEALEKPRRFVKSKNYAGPDRRRRQMANNPGRRAEDSAPQYPTPKNKWIVPPKT